MLLEEEEHPLALVTRWEHERKKQSKGKGSSGGNRRGSKHFSLRRSNWVESGEQPKQLLFKQWFYAPEGAVEEEARRARSAADAAHWLEYIDARWHVMNGLYTVMPTQVPSSSHLSPLFLC